jgi:iron(III) transport system permease protein
MALALLTAAAVAMPVASIIGLALRPVPELWPELVSYVLPRTLRDTALLLAGVGVLTLTLGTATAWLTATHDFPGRALLVWLLPLPLAIPTYIAAYVYVDLFEPLGLVHQALMGLMPPREAAQLLPALRSLPGAVVVMGLVLYPYVYLSARTMFQMQSAEVAEAADTLGASHWVTFWRVSLPMARPALAVGLALALLETLNDIGASEYLGVNTFTASIFAIWLNHGSLPGAAQMACLALAVVAALVALEHYGTRGRVFSLSSENPRLAPRTRLTGFAGLAAATTCWLPVLLGFILPLCFLVYQSLRRGLHTQIAGLAGSLTHTLIYAAIATTAALLLGLAVLTAQRWRPGLITRGAAAVSLIGYALPGLVLALGLLAPLVAFDNAIGNLARRLGLASPGLLLLGSGAAVAIAYVIRFLAVASGFFRAAYARIPLDYDDGARITGAGQLTTMRRVHLPLLRPALWSAAIIVFVDCLKELPATLLLRPLNVETLATSIYQYASRGGFEDGSPAALLIVGASVVPVIFLTRLADTPLHADTTEAPAQSVPVSQALLIATR